MNKNLGSLSGNTTFATVEKPLTSADVAYDGDFVKLASGRFTTGSIGTGKLFGTVNGSDSTNLDSRSHRDTATGNAGGTVTVIAEVAGDNRYLLPVNADLASDAEGSYYNLTGAPGSQIVANATKSATVGQLLCIRRIVSNAAGTQYRLGEFIVAASQTVTTAA